VVQDHVFPAEMLQNFSIAIRIFNVFFSMQRINYGENSVVVARLHKRPYTINNELEGIDLISLPENIGAQEVVRRSQSVANKL
jgi:hypothetical protein